MVARILFILSLSLSACATQSSSPPIVELLDGRANAFDAALWPEGITVAVFSTVWCDACRHAEPEIEVWARKNAKVARTVLVVSGSSLDDVEKMVRVREIDSEVIRVAADPTGAVASRYGVSVTPTIIAFGREGQRLGTYQRIAEVPIPRSGFVAVTDRTDVLCTRVFRSGRHWAIEVPILGIVTQGLTKKEAFTMIADAVESLADKRGFKVGVHPGEGEMFSSGSEDQATLAAFLLRRVREKSGLSFSEAAERLGASSRNAYVRYEQGKAMPTITKLSELVRAISGRDFVLSEVR